MNHHLYVAAAEVAVVWGYITMNVAIVLYAGRKAHR